MQSQSLSEHYHHQQLQLSSPFGMMNEDETYIDLSNETSESNACFKRGTYIELSNGVLRRVEDIRTEDFIQSAMRSQLFDVKEATVVKIERSELNPSVVIISFSYDSKYSKVHLAVQESHPIFVYGQGWASCNPPISQELFQLKCQLLQVGDICLSLVPHEEPEETPPPAPPPLPPISVVVPEPAPLPDFQTPMMPMMDMSFGFDSNACQINPYQVYAEMANFVAAYTQQLLGEMHN